MLNTMDLSTEYLIDAHDLYYYYLDSGFNEVYSKSLVKRQFPLLNLDQDLPWTP